MERDNSIDIAKTLGIALVVLGHIQGYGESTGLLHLRNFIYQFHVPLFFFLSGFLFNETEEWTIFLEKKIKRLYIPYIVWNLFFFAINLTAQIIAGNSYAPTDAVKHCFKILLGIAVTPLGGATWFLITLLESLLLYKLLTTLFILLIIKTFTIILLATLIIGISGILVRMPYGLEKALVALFFVCIGHLANKFRILEHLGNRQRIPIMISGFLIVWLLSTMNNADMAFHEYGNLIIYLVSAIIGIFSTIILSSCISQISQLAFLGRWGSVTIWVLIWHLLAFKTVTLLQICLFRQSWKVLFSFPCYNVESFWPLLYFIAGFFLPIAAAYIYKFKFCNQWQGSLS